LTDLQFDVAKAVAKQFDHPLYKAVFPKGLSGLKKVTNADLRTECKRIRGVLAMQPSGGALHAYVARLDTLDKAWAAPVAEHDKASAAFGLAATQFGTVKHEWYLAYDAMPGLLRALFPDRRAFVDSFFLDVAPPKKAALPPAVPQ